MARVFQTGGETGSPEVFDQTHTGVVSTTVTRGAWSSYSLDDGATAGFQASLDSAASEIYGGFGLYLTNVGPASARRIAAWSSPNATQQVSLDVSPAGKLQAFRGDGSQFGGGTSLGTGTATLVTSRWYYIEYHITVNAATGVFQVKIDNTTDIDLSAQNTKNDGASSTIDRIYLGSDGFAFQKYFDDIYVNDTTGTQNTGYSGDIRISAYIPNAAGDVTGFTPTAGANYTNVDERPPNDATDIVAGTGTTLYDLYNIPNTSSVATVQAVTLWLRAQKSDAGTKSVAPMIKSGATENQGSDQTLSTTWAYYRKNYNVDPTDSAAWTALKVDSLQIGAKAR